MWNVFSQQRDLALSILKASHTLTRDIWKTYSTVEDCFKTSRTRTHAHCLSWSIYVNLIPQAHFVHVHLQARNVKWCTDGVFCCIATVKSPVDRFLSPSPTQLEPFLGYEDYTLALVMFRCKYDNYSLRSDRIISGAIRFERETEWLKIIRATVSQGIFTWITKQVSSVCFLFILSLLKTDRETFWRLHTWLELSSGSKRHQ